MDIPIFNEDGGQVGTVSIDEKKLLGEKVRTKLLHQAIIRYEANLRVGTHKTKSKAERHGSGIKPWKQKHTGRARAGMKRSPLWRGGGNAFPIRQRDYHKDMPVRMRREALKSAILSKILDKEIKVIDGLNYDKPKTKRFTTSLKKLGLAGTSCLVSVRNPADALVKSVRNIDRVRILPARNLNAYEVLKHKHLIINKDTLENLAEVVKA
ncbi:MAG TPA: 50S ribosomal protein L4 [Planctomycetota bacterium]|nr:50S ribosomal protein L4 [Planctomycetota bacterium]